MATQSYSRGDDVYNPSLNKMAVVFEVKAQTVIVRHSGGTDEWNIADIEPAPADEYDY